MAWYEFASNAAKLHAASLRAIAALSLATWALSVHAGRPMIVDDASILDVKTCQLESWVQNSRAGTEYWIVPACNFSGNLEVALGGARVVGMEGTHTIAVMHGKTLFKPLDTNGWGAGVIFGNQFNPDGSLFGDLYMNVPVSFSFRDDQFLTHANLGWLREKNSRHHAMTWGLGVEARLTDRTALTTETFGQNRGKPFFQLGVRHWVIPDRMQIDATYGDRFGRGSAERFFSIGMVLFSNSIFP